MARPCKPTRLVLMTLLLSASITSEAAEPSRPAPPAGKRSEAAQIERGRYLVKLGGCNDCHTSGYAQSGGQVDEKQWLLGDRLGWRGPWGTTYASNLRLYVANLSEEQWIQTARRLQARPPMPWFTLRGLREEDLRAMYKFIRYLGPAGEPAPAYLPPDREPPQPYVQFPQPPQ